MTQLKGPLIEVLVVSVRQKTWQCEYFGDIFFRGDDDVSGIASWHYMTLLGTRYQPNIESSTFPETNMAPKNDGFQ